MASNRQELLIGARAAQLATAIVGLSPLERTRLIPMKDLMNGTGTDVTEEDSGWNGFQSSIVPIFTLHHQLRLDSGFVDDFVSDDSVLDVVKRMESLGSGDWSTGSPCEGSFDSEWESEWEFIPKSIRRPSVQLPVASQPAKVLELSDEDIFEDFTRALFSTKPPPKKQLSADYTCHSCGQKNHLIEDCPNKSVDKGYKGPKPCVNFYKCAQPCCRHEFYKLLSVSDDNQNCNKKGCCASDIVAQFDLMNLTKDKEAEVVKKICRLKLQKPSNFNQLSAIEQLEWTSKTRQPKGLVAAVEQEIRDAKVVVYSFYELFNLIRTCPVTLDMATQFQFTLALSKELMEKLTHLSKLYDNGKVGKLAYVVNDKLVKTYLKNF